MHIINKISLFIAFVFYTFDETLSIPVNKITTSLPIKLTTPKLASPLSTHSFLKGVKIIKHLNTFKNPLLSKKHYKIKLPFKPKPLQLQKPQSKAFKRETNNNPTIAKKNVPLFRNNNYFMRAKLFPNNPKRTEWDELQNVMGDKLIGNSATFTPIIAYAMPIRDRFEETATEQFVEEYYQPINDNNINTKEPYNLWSKTKRVDESRNYYGKSNQETTLTTQDFDSETIPTEATTYSAASLTDKTVNYKKDADVTSSLEFTRSPQTTESPLGDRGNVVRYGERHSTTLDQSYAGYVPRNFANSSYNTRREILEGLSGNGQFSPNLTSRFGRASSKLRHGRDDGYDQEYFTSPAEYNEEPQKLPIKLFKEQYENDNESDNESDYEQTESQVETTTESNTERGAHITGTIEFDSDFTKNLISQLLPATEFETEPTEPTEDEFQITVTDRGYESDRNYEGSEIHELQIPYEPEPATSAVISSTKFNKYNYKTGKHSARDKQSESKRKPQTVEENFETNENSKQYAEFESNSYDQGDSKESEWHSDETNAKECEYSNENKYCPSSEPCCVKLNSYSRKNSLYIDEYKDRKIGKRYAEALLLRNKNASFSLGVEKTNGMLSYAFYKD